MKRYAVHEMFLTLQGEGVHAGRRAVFVRFAGCNVWSGNPEHRERDAIRGCCSRWCDTEFRGTEGNGGGLPTAEELKDAVCRLWDAPGQPLMVATGGEPGLQLDAPLLVALHEGGVIVHVETNGSKVLPDTIDWVTLSPKPPMAVVLQHFDEVKVIYPVGIDPLAYEELAPIRFVQPLDDIARKQNTARCIEFVMNHPAWRLSIQLHKDIGLP